MRPRFGALLTGFVAAALFAAPSALAQESPEASIQLRGVSLAEEMADTLANAGVVSLPDAAVLSEPAPSDGDEPASPSGLQPLAPAEDSGSASALPWYERFTEARPQRLTTAWGDQAAQFSFTAGERWGFTLGFADRVRGRQFELADMSAGAFFRLNDRFRLGGELRFSSPEEDVFGEEGEERSPELKFESAFRF